MQLDLISPPEHQPELESANRPKDKRPPSISVEKLNPTAHRWRECKIIGKNISIRSYGAACSFEKRYLRLL